MSRFIERLKKVGEAGPMRMGFGPANRRDNLPSVLLVGLTSASVLKTGQLVQKAALDAVVISFKNGDGPLSVAKDALKDTLWGLWPAADSTSEAVEEIKANGGDFVVFAPEGTSAEVLQEEELGKIVVLGSEVDEDTARGLDALSVDAAVLRAPDNLLPLTVKKLIDIEASRCLVSKDVLLLVPSVLGSKELIAIRDLGIDAVIVDIEKVKISDLEDMRAAIDGLPRRKSKSERLGAMLPRAGLGFGAIQPRKEEEDDGEEDE